MNTEDLNVLISDESPLDGLLSVTDSVFDLFKLQPTTADWPEEVQGIAENLRRMYEFQKKRVHVELKLLQR